MRRFLFIAILLPGLCNATVASAQETNEDFAINEAVKEVPADGTVVASVQANAKKQGSDTTGNYDMTLATQQAEQAERIAQASAPQVRRFHEVLDELLAEFGYDVRMKQLAGLKNLSIRRVAVSDTLPLSYSEYVELLVSERIRENARVRLITCIPCKTKTSRLVDSKLLITSPVTNVVEMSQAAEQLGIENFMDVVLVYHTTHMVLAFQIFDTSTKELVWTRTYNSETVKTRYQKLAVDYSQVAMTRTGEDYVPDYRYLFGVGGASVPNVGGQAGDASFATLNFRGTERFNNRKSEFGLMVSFYNAFSTFLSSYPTQGAPTTATPTTPESGPRPFTTALGLYALYAQNFLGALESYNDVRQGAHFGVGGLFASGYLALTGRAGWDVHFGRAFVLTAAGLYVAPSTILIGGEQVRTKGGTGGELVVSYNF